MDHSLLVPVEQNQQASLSMWAHQHSYRKGWQFTEFQWIGSLSTNRPLLNRKQLNSPSLSKRLMFIQSNNAKIKTYHFVVLSQSHVILWHSNAEYNRCHTLETMYPLFTFRSLPSHIEHPLKGNNQPDQQRLLWMRNTCLTCTSPIIHV